MPHKVLQPQYLEIMFSKEEIKQSVFSLLGEKSLSLDRFPLCFYHHFWNVIKFDLVDLFQFFYQSESIDILSSINQTFIALIPKKRMIERIQDFRLISLLNSSYKIISKCLATRLSFVLNHLMDDSQCAFLLRCNISDCFLVAQETLHLIHTSSKPGLMLKLDFEKAFDNVNWEFLIDSLKGFGFSDK